MVALRKDVKVGLTIGAIAVSVIGVYAGLSALATDKPATDDTAKLNVSPMDGKKVEAKKSDTATSVADRTPTRIDTSKGLLAGTTVTPAPISPTNPNNPPAIANSDQPLAAKPVATGEDPWAAAFGTGRIQPAVTTTPEPGKAGIANSASDRADTIKSINGTPDASKATASANDPSGSMNTGNSSAVLTKATGTPTGDASKAAVSTGPEKSHTVVAGETLSAISSEYYGEAKYFSLIIAANPQVNPNKLKPGTVLKIPALAKKDEKSDTVDQPAAATMANFDATKQYVVKSGDSLHKIASELYNDSTMSTKIYDANKTLIGADPAKLKVGMVLALPSAPTTKK